MSDRNMLYRNPYGGYSDNEYGYNNNNNSSETPKGHNTHGSSNGYGHYNGGHSHFGQEDWSRTNGYTTSQVLSFAQTWSNSHSYWTAMSMSIQNDLFTGKTYPFSPFIHGYLSSFYTRMYNIFLERMDFIIK